MRGNVSFMTTSNWEDNIVLGHFRSPRQGWTGPHPDKWNHPLSAWTLKQVLTTSGGGLMRSTLCCPLLDSLNVTEIDRILKIPKDTKQNRSIKNRNKIIKTFSKNERY